MTRIAALLPLIALGACQPSATDDYVARIGIEERAAPSDPIDSPDTKGARWVPVESRDGGAARLVFGKSGQAPLMALECEQAIDATRVVYTRYARADADAQAVLALIGNGHVARLWIDATRDGNRWLWRGAVPAGDRGLEPLTGGRQVEATVAGAGSLILNPSPLPGQLIAGCRRQEDRAADRR